MVASTGGKGSAPKPSTTVGGPVALRASDHVVSGCLNMRTRERALLASTPAERWRQPEFGVRNPRCSIFSRSGTFINLEWPPLAPHCPPIRTAAKGLDARKIVLIV